MEVLVVMVVFLIGILAIVQIFPGGFKALRTTQNNTTATEMARQITDMMKNHASQLPERILPVSYFWNGSQWIIQADPERFTSNIGAAYTTLDNTGTMFDAGNNPVGNWQYLTAANIARRVVGEGRDIPAPRQVGNDYGSLLTLQFAPVFFSPQFISGFLVYGNDLTKRGGDPIADSIQVRRTEYYVDDLDRSSANITFACDPARQLTYKVDFTYWNGTKRIDVVDFAFSAPAQSGPVQQTFATLSGDTVQAVEYDSIRVARVFDDVNVTNGGAFHTNGGIPNEPYEYKLLSNQLGLVLFSPAGYNYTVRSRRGRPEKLVGKVSYDVYDWRILREEFRVPDQAPYQHKLALGNLKVSGSQGPDGAPIAGIGIQVPDAAGAMGNTDLILLDTSSGGLVAFKEGTGNPNQTSYTIDKSMGRITFADHNAGAPGLQLMVQYPGAAAPIEITAEGRSFRAMYMARGEWAAQVLKPSARYIQTWGRPGVGQFYVGASDPNLVLDGTRVYFPPADAGRIVSLGELYYINTAGISVGPVQLTAKLQTNLMDQGLPYIPIREYFPDFQAFDYSYGGPVKSVKGASVSVRVFWNPDTFNLGPNSNENMERLNTWMQSYRRQTVETYLQRENP